MKRSSEFLKIPICIIGVLIAILYCCFRYRAPDFDEFRDALASEATTLSCSGGLTEMFKSTLESDSCYYDILNLIGIKCQPNIFENGSAIYIYHRGAEKATIQVHFSDNKVTHVQMGYESVPKMDSALRTAEAFQIRLGKRFPGLKIALDATVK